MSGIRTALVSPALVIAMVACQTAPRPTVEASQPPAAQPSHAADREVAALAHEVFDLARAGDTETLTRILRPGFPIEMRNERGDTLLILAAYYGHGDVVELLVDHGADVEGTNDQGNTALMGACFKGDLGVVARLLRRGATPDALNGAGQSALMFAALFDHGHVTRELIEAGADPDRPDAAGRTARMLARGQGAAAALAAMGPAASSDPGGGAR